MQTNAQRRAALRYRKDTVKYVQLALYPRDADIVEWLDNLQGEGKQEYLRRLIREDIERSKS